VKLSPLRHNLARLRLFLNLGQKEMAELAGCSMRAIQSVELGTLRLSESLARRISVATGVHLRWLLENNLKAPAIKADCLETRTMIADDVLEAPRAGARLQDLKSWAYTRHDFEAARARKKFGDSELDQKIAAHYAASFYGQIRAILSSAGTRALADVATWRIAKFLDDCRSEFGHDTKLIGTEEQFGLRADDSPYLKHRQVNAGISLFRKYNQERTRSIRQTLAQLKEAQNKKAQSKKA
jgi:transcriptional regulator with XRE-family HTH domain